MRLGETNPNLRTLIIALAIGSECNLADIESKRMGVGV